MLKRILIFTCALLLSLSLSAQENTIRLTVSGEGTTKEEATANALRSAIEQAFGTFVSANTQILNDEIVKDEIATISSGNIKEYSELSYVTMPDGSKFVSLSATVSIGNLISYAKSKGSSAEFAGAAFTMNMRMRKLNAENEITALYNMLEQLYILAPSVFDWELEVGNPAVLPEQKYEVPMIAKAKTNKNTASFFSIIFNTLESLSLSPSEVEGYKVNKMEVYTLKVEGGREYILRNDYQSFMVYVRYLINCIAESFHIYGQFGDQKTKLFYDLKKMFLAHMDRRYSTDPYTFEIENLDTFMNEAPGSIAFQRDLSVSLDENALYQLYGFEVVPAPNISRITFVRKNGMMTVDTMNVYQSVTFWPHSAEHPSAPNCPCREALRQMRVLYVSEDCPARPYNLDFEGYDNLQKVTIEKLGGKYGTLYQDTFRSCKNLETVLIGKGVKKVGSRAFYDNPKISTVIIGTTLTFGEDVIDLTSLTEKDLQDIIIYGDGVTSIDSNEFGKRNVSQKSLSVVLKDDVLIYLGLPIYPQARFIILLGETTEFSSVIESNKSELILVPKEHLSDYQKKYYNPYYKKEFAPLEDKMSESGSLDLLSLLKRLCQSNFPENISEDNVTVIEEIEEVIVEEPIPFQLLDEKPSFQGGDVNQFSKWVRQNLIYPETAKENGVQGRVTVQAIINSDGSLSDIRVLRGCDRALDKEAVRVISLSPKWEPGKQRGRAVPTICTFPVIFTL